MSNEEVTKQEGGMEAISHEEIEKIGAEEISRLVDVFSKSQSFGAAEQTKRNVIATLKNKVSEERAKAIVEQITDMTQECRKLTHKPSYKTAVMHKVDTGKELPQKTDEEQQIVDSKVEELKSAIKNKLLSQ